MIRLEGINKSFRISKRNPGFGNAVKALFSREYQTVEALKDITFSIDEGEMVGYIGPNGAGKSTSIKIMCGILTPDSGNCEINGKIPWKDRVNHVKDIGVIFGQRSQLWWDVPVGDSFELLRDIYRIPHADYNKMLRELAEMLNIADILRIPARSLSLGQRMRCELAASLLHNPRVLFLDEPTIGLDAVSKIAVRSFIKKLNKKSGTTVILTTHDMQDIEALTQRILLIGGGRILLDDSLSTLKSRFSGRRILTLEYTGQLPPEQPGLSYTAMHENRLLTAEIETADCSVAEAINYISGTADIHDISVSGIRSEEMVAALYEEYQI